MDKNKSILILGAGSDIAKAIARRFAVEGYDVQLAGRDQEQLGRLQTDLISRYDIEATVCYFDARDFESHLRVISELPVLPDIVLYAAGVMHDQRDADSDWQKTLNMISVNYSGAISVLNVIAHLFRERGSGCIVGISSVAGERGRGSNYLYGSTKAGFTTYLSGLRNALFKKGVHVVTVKPGFVYTKMTQDIALPARLTAKAQKVADDVYKAVLKKKNVIYVKPVWRAIMQVIRSIPESVFKKANL